MSTFSSACWSKVVALAFVVASIVTVEAVVPVISISSTSALAIVPSGIFPAAISSDFLPVSILRVRLSDSNISFFCLSVKESIGGGVPSSSLPPGFCTHP